MDYEIINDIRCELGEGPVWDAKTKCFYYVDISGKKVYRIDRTGKPYAFDTPEQVGCFILTGGDTAVVGMETGIYTMNLSDNTYAFLCHPAADEDSERYNDGKASPDGKLFIGTIGGEGRCALYCVGRGGTHETVTTGVTISNGLAWDVKRGALYYIDTPAQCVYAFDYTESGASGKRVCIRIPEENGMPDGMTIDEEGKLWVALWGGGMVGRYDPGTGALLQKIMLPAKNITSAAFCGDNLDELWVTSAGDNGRSPADGALFRIKPGVRGFASDRYILI